MASTTTLTPHLELDGAEVFDAADIPGAVNKADRTISVGGATRVPATALNSSSTPKVDQSPVSLTVTTTSTIDLTAVQGGAIPATATRTLNMTGKKLVAFGLRAPETNASAITVAHGASNPYPFIGTGHDLTIQPGETIMSCFKGINTSKPAVSSSVKTIDVTISGSDKLYVDLYFSS